MQTQKWWKEAVAYQIYPKSFMDSNGDGIGDLNGIEQRLDHLEYLGVDVIWLCPMYKSPQDDNGYDISDYQGIDPSYGTMADFDRLLGEIHRRGMRLIIDLVINHTSDEHPWFVESRSSRTSPKRDWYIWRDGKGEKEPNNWESIFGGSAWAKDEQTGQYYLHLFSTKQPDLNWENPSMREEIYRMIRWWLDKGVDGFRVDAISHIRKRAGLPDLPNPDRLPYVPSYANHMNVPGIQEYLEDLSAQTFRRYDIMTVGEANGVAAEDASQWVGEKGKFSMLFQFEHLDLWSTSGQTRIDLPRVKEVFTRWQKGLARDGWNALYVENHDIPRITSKWGNEDFWRESATSIATLYFLQQGTPFIYQGQEIGMTNTVFRGPEDFDDVRARNLFAQRRREGVPDPQTVAELSAGSRDNARTPMQWDEQPNGGFSTGRPWLKVNPNYPRINVAAQKGVTQSVLEYYRELIRLRREHSLFIYGDYDLILPDHPQLYAYTRTLAGRTATVFCNLSPREVALPAVNGDLVLGNYSSPRAHLGPFEARVYIEKK